MKLLFFIFIIVEFKLNLSFHFKVHVEAGKEDCYWQYVHQGATLYVSYQVLFSMIDGYLVLIKDRHRQPSDNLCGSTYIHIIIIHHHTPQNSVANDILLNR